MPDLKVLESISDIRNDSVPVLVKGKGWILHEAVRSHDEPNAPAFESSQSHPKDNFGNVMPYGTAGEY